MKYFFAFLALLVWGVVTIVMTVSVIGIVLLIAADYLGDWISIGRELALTFKK